MVYQSAYKAYMALGKMIQILLCATMILHLVFHTGILAVIVVGVIYLDDDTHISSFLCKSAESKTESVIL